MKCMSLLTWQKIFFFIYSKISFGDREAKPSEGGGNKKFNKTCKKGVKDGRTKNLRSFCFKKLIKCKLGR